MSFFEEGDKIRRWSTIIYAYFSPLKFIEEQKLLVEMKSDE